MRWMCVLFLLKILTPCWFSLAVAWLLAAVAYTPNACAAGQYFNTGRRSEYREYPGQPGQICICSHPWLRHLRADNNNSQFLGARGPAPSQPAATRPQSLFVEAERPAPSTAFSLFAPSPPSGPVLPPPVAAYQGLHGSGTFAPFQKPQPASGTIQVQRGNSIHRMHVDAGSSPAGKTKRKKPATSANSNNPFGLPDDNSNDLFAPPDAPIQAIANGPSPGFVRFLLIILPFTTGEFEEPAYPSPPLAITTSTHLRPLLDIVERAGLSTVLDLRKSAAQSQWPTILQTILDHLTQHNLQFGHHPDHPASTTAFEFAPFQLLEMRNGQVQQHRNFTPANVLERDLNTSKLTKISRKTRHPEEENINPLFFNPRWKNLRGQGGFNMILGTHLCYPWHVFHGSGIFQGSAPVTHCIAGCPDVPEVGLTQTANTYRAPRDNKRKRSPGSSEDGSYSDDDSNSESSEVPVALAPPRRRHRSPIEADDNEFPVALAPPRRRPHQPYIEVDDFSDGHSDSPIHEDLPHPQAIVAPEPPPSERRAEIEQQVVERERQANDLVGQVIQSERDSGVPAVAVLCGRDVLQWRTNVCTAVNSDDVKSLYIAGPSVPAMADTLVSLIRALVCDQPISNVVPSTGVELEPVPSFAGFLGVDRSFQVRADDHETASGDGVERSVFVAGLTSRVQDNQRWGASSGMYSRPVFYGIPGVRRETHITEFAVDGAWVALYMVLFGVGPDPICPFMLLAATRKDHQWLGDLSLEYIHALDPSAARLLAPWFAITADTVFKLPDEGSHSALLLVAAFLPIPVCRKHVSRVVLTGTTP
ncbi:hypothetical protein B0H16DRAFT_1809971 [Mycena metata]|uniref:Uncharacterized protein n=1 Tax=Mycena metata TaxID=1033252 RepID=A0AAD7JG10_9AGAR|nr:hypothetical protein B0H16DRAFT_1809971 [Mycena metata]